MVKNDAVRKIEKAFNKLSRSQVYESLELLQEAAGLTNNSQMVDIVNAEKNAYSEILKNSFDKIHDDDKDEIYKKEVLKIYETADSILFNLKGNKNYDIIASVDNIESHIAAGDLKGIIEGDEKSNDFDHELKAEINTLFKKLWFPFKIEKEEYKRLKELFQGDALLWYYKSMLVSALTINLLECFDKNKFFLLEEIYSFKEDQVWHRALTGFFIALDRYKKRLHLYPGIEELLQRYSGNKSFLETMEIIQIQLLRSKDADKVNKKLNEEILPDVKKATPKIMDKLDIDNLTSDSLFDDENPEWSKVFEDTPGLYDKIEEISKMQMEGSDVFLSAFSMLKSFSFFNNIINWFTPFYKENPEVNEALRDEDFDKNEFIGNLEESSFMCNSDKYSFCLNVSMIPSSQKSMMTNMFEQELKALAELKKEDSIVNKKAIDKTIITQYIQDIYRFFNLYPKRHNFNNPFAGNLRFVDCNILRKFEGRDSLRRNIGEFYFSSASYENALEVFINIQNTEDSELLEKTGWCYQKTNKFDSALKYYRMAELVSKNTEWLQKNEVYCLKKLGKISEIKLICEDNLRKKPDNKFFINNLAYALIDTKEWEEALKLFLNLNIWTPIALK